MLILAGIVLFVFGIVLVSGLLDWLLDLTGIILIVVGIALAIYGFMNRSKSSSTDF